MPSLARATTSRRRSRPASHSATAPACSTTCTPSRGLKSDRLPPIECVHPQRLVLLRRIRQEDLPELVEARHPAGVAVPIIRREAIEQPLIGKLLVRRSARKAELVH